MARPILTLAIIVATIIMAPASAKSSLNKNTCVFVSEGDNEVGRKLYIELDKKQ
ncbi:hypothetical protein P2G88_11615 [Aliiglaciecola sp. CAU 1673]|uniref:hypothetical protein n=1 Tax=Aliiglaciecola sp. CAU 1673 TaxID=3032595 RepID=UPI0023DAEEC4|nr:hypothetical protein [Aliiglaciecola sp. CAU 1673]MDF2178897.1 hypothetical protein [Aliiglaciecola sp. CAU 1673]